MSGSRSNLIARINNVDLGDHSSLQIVYKQLMLDYIDLGGPGFGGDKFYVDPVNGSDSNDGTGADDAKLTLAAGYALLTDNANDILYFIGGASTLNIPSGFAWAKSYAHFIGLCSSIRHGGRCRLNHTEDFTPIFPISGSGCQFSNIHIQHGNENAANLISTALTGSRNSFINCHWEGPLGLLPAAQGFRELQFGTSAEANSFFSCSIGAWSVQATGATGTEIEFLGNVSDTVFEDCIIRCMNDDATHQMITATAGVGDGSITVTYDNCTFIQHDSSAPLNTLITAPTNGYILLKNCTGVRGTAFSTDNTKVLEAGSNLV